MPGVFLSYDRDDTAEARPVAAALEKAGHAVWWDLHVRGGAQFSKVIEEALKAADAVVVLWSRNAIESAWVRDEAGAGRDRGILIPVTLDGTEPPLGFRQFQTIDLSGWKGRRSAPGVRELLQAIDATAGRAVSPEASPHPSSDRQRNLSRVPFAAGIVAFFVVAVAAALFVWRPWSSANPPSVAVSPADASPASADLARHLLTSLGELQAPSSAQVDLVGPEERGRASLGFEVSASNDAQRSRGNLVLVDAKTRSLLWSKAFERPGAPDDLRQQISYTAARVLRCALDAYPHDHLVVKGETLRLYLNGCASFSNEDFGDYADLVPVFRQVVSSSSSFEEGWSKLLMTESQTYVNTGDPEIRAQLIRDMQKARAVSPRLAAAYAAEMDMLPDGAWSQKLAIADRGIAANPNDTWLLMLRSEVLGDVGRLRDASDDARAAAHADPLSPQLRAAYASSLAGAGQLDAALSELAAAERLWPDSGIIARNKFQINFDYGDPRYALQVIQSGLLQGGWAHTTPFMEARIDPTPAKVARAIENAQASYRRNPQLHIWLYAEVLSAFNRYDDVLGLLMAAPLDQARSVKGVTFSPYPAKFWHHPQSLAYAQRVGLLQFWQSSGKWPDFCFDPDLPYDCKKEAAKLSA
jgi:tetratricopeptide (TPR) repeat protein